MAPRNSKSKFPRADPLEEPSSKVFEIDTTGSASIRHSILHGSIAPRARKGVQRSLKVDEILNQSNLLNETPAVAGRVRPNQSSSSGGSNKKVKLLSSEERKRLNRIVIRKGHNSGIASIDPEKRSGTTSAIKPPPAPADDIWSSSSNSKTTISNLSPPNVLVPTTSIIPPTKPPSTLNHNDVIEKVIESLPSNKEGLKPIPIPHPGQSYNPTLDDHQGILRSTLEKLEEEQNELEKISKIKDRISSSMKNVNAKAPWENFEEEVGDGEEDESSDDENEGDDQKEQENSEGLKRKKVTKRKTAAQRKRKARALEEARILAKKKEAKALAHSIHEIRKIHKGLNTSKAESEKERSDRKARRAALVAQYGLNAVRGGKPKGLEPIVDRTEFQLTEDLTESGLRGLKIEGNLWRDWSKSSIRRGKIESKPKIGLIKGQRFEKGRMFKEVEKHAWKNFEA